jgi:RNA polymerase sigma-70 factor (ECF subfamily)
MSTDPSFADLMARLRAGDEAAAEEVFRRFTQRLIGLARQHLDQQIRHKLDPEDVLQSVYRSFFRRQAEGHYDLDSWEGLWGMLTVITVRKCGHRVKYYRAARRDVQREVAPAVSDTLGPDWEALAREPTPSAAALLAETVEQLLRGLSEREREVVALGLCGYTPAEISPRVGRTERTVQRVLKRVRQRLEQMQAE